MSLGRGESETTTTKTDLVGNGFTYLKVWGPDHGVENAVANLLSNKDMKCFPTSQMIYGEDGQAHVFLALPGGEDK